MTKSERLKYIASDHWINYPVSVNTIKQLNQLLEFEPSHRPQSLLIISESNNGKTIIAKRFVSAHPPRLSLSDDGQQIITLDVLMIQCPYTADERMFFFSILDKLNIVYKSSVKKQDLLSIVLSALKRLKLRVLILDEIHHVFGGARNKREDFLKLIKYMSNEIEICIVGIGTREAFYVVNSDPQLANRFNKTIIPKWKYDNDFLSLLATFQSIIKLNKEYTLVEPKISQAIYELGEGLLGEYVKIVKLCALHAIESEEEIIDIKTLSKIDYISPSKRRDERFLEI